MDSTSQPTSAFGPILRQARETRSLGLRELAGRTGISPGLLSRIETGARTAPPLETVLRIAAALGLQQSSPEFQDLLHSWREVRDPYNERLADDADELTAVDQLLAGVPMPPKVTVVVLCDGIAKLAAEVTHTLFQRADEVAAITVQFEDGTTKRIQLTKEGNDSKDE